MPFTAATSDGAHDADATLLSEALEVPVETLRTLSREPLGAGTVAGFVLPAAAEGGPEEVAYIDSSQLAVTQETGLALDGVARVWIHPADPHLPALAPAAFGDAVSVLLGRLGIHGAAMPEIVGYRPGRRAVLRVPTGDGAMWVKVVRPRRIERVVAAHAALRDQGLPVPAVRGWSPQGLMVLDAAEGEPATEVTWHPDVLLDEVTRLRDRLAAASLDWPARTSLRERMPWYLERLRAHGLEHGSARWHERADQLTTIETAVAEAPSATEVVTIHGDLHLGQLFVDGDTITGLIDVDTAGAGGRGDDAAAFIAHALSSALLTEQSGRDADRVWALAASADERWGHDPYTRSLVAVQLLGHAVGASAGGDPQRAGRLLDLAERAVSLPKSPLIAPFEEP